MSQRQFTSSIRWVLGAFVAASVAWAGCSSRESVDAAGSSLITANGTITQGADEARTNWYPDQPGLDPAVVGGPNFKRLFKTALPLTAGELVLAQPLVVNGKVLIVTEANNLYLLDAVTGAITNQRALGSAYNASAAIGCGDISPTVGITGTPVVDANSSTAYFFSKDGSGVYTFHAVDTGNLAERTGFPVTIGGAAQNDPAITFDSVYEHQRPGMLFMNGVAYGAFAAHCDKGANYEGWIIGVSSTGEIKTRFTTEAHASGHGAGIWQSGAGLASDGLGQILFATGNGYTNNYAGPIASNAPPTYLEEAVGRVVVQADGTLKPTDWFAPFNATNMGDDDLSGGGITALPSQFGTTTVPNTAVIVGKAGLFYLLNRDKLGGYQQGPGGSDNVLTTINLSGGTWGHPAVWPGDGGYVFVTSNGGTGGLGYRLQVLKYGTSGTNPTFTLVGTATSGSPATTDNFGAGAGSPTVTSNGTNAGSAVVWLVNNTAQLRAYKLASPNLTRIFVDPTNSFAKYQTVGVGAGRVYVGTGDGNVIGYGAGTSAVTGAPLDFGTVVVGQSKTLTATITANQALTIPVGGLSSSNGVYVLGAPNPGLPANLPATGTLTVPVTFTPTAAGAVSGSINITIQGGGGGTLVLSGAGQVNGPQLNITPATLSFGSIVTGTTKQLSVSIQNAGNQPLTFSGSSPPAVPFSASSVPASGSTLAAGATTTATLTFAPTADGMYTTTFTINSNGGNATLQISGSSGAAPQMVITPLALNFGTISSGGSSTQSFTIKNTGGTDLQITKSKPPALGQFVATTTLPEGGAISAGQTVTESVTFSTTAGGTYNDAWIITGSDASGVQNVSITGTVSAALSRSGWVASASDAAADAGNVLDNNLGTRWTSGKAMTAGMYFQVDMGTSNTVTQIVLDSNGSNDYSRAYSVYVTDDTGNLGTPVAQGTAAATPITVPCVSKTGRFVRVVLGTVPAGVTNWWSIHEFNVYGTAGAGGGGGGGAGSGGAGSGGSASLLSRTGWVPSASDNTVDAGNVTDGNLGTRWTSTKAMAAGMYFQIDMGVSNSVSKIVMDSNGSADYARTYSVYVSDDTANFGSAVAQGTASATPITVSCTTKTGRFVRVVLGTVPAGVTNWWSIHEFNVYGSAGAGGGGSGGAGGGGAGGGGAGGAGGAGAGGAGGSTAALLPRTGWVPSASDNPVDANSALDGNLGSRWTSGKAMTAGMYFQVDMISAKTVTQIVMDANGSNDYSRAYSVYVTNDLTNLGTAVGQGTASSNTPITVPCAPKSGRYVRIVLGAVPAGVTNWWSIHELNVYGTSP